MQIGFFGLFALILITLKLLGAITLSWWLVLLPVYGPPVLIGALAVVGLYVINRDGL